MKRFHRVVVGTDFTPGAVRAARRALCLPLARGAAIDLIHAAPQNAPRAFEAVVKQAALTALDRQAAALVRRAGASPPRIRKSLASGPPADALTREAAARRGELMVVGAHADHGLPDLDLGSTAERLLAASASPVLIVRRPGRLPYRHALVAVDPGGSSARALALAMTLVREAGGRVTLLHAVELPVEAGVRLAGTSAVELERLRDRGLDEAARFLAAEARRVRRAGLAVDWVLSDLDARSAILRTARRLRADLVAMGTRRRRDRTGFLIGSVARWVARRAACDVLVVRANP
jgi:CPA2 family monovalent cation:H+ antiporter-2